MFGLIRGLPLPVKLSSPFVGGLIVILLAGGDEPLVSAVIFAFCALSTLVLARRAERGMAAASPEAACQGDDGEAAAPVVQNATVDYRRIVQDLADSFEGTVKAVVEQVAQASARISGVATNTAQRSNASGDRTFGVGDTSATASERVDSVAAATQQLAGSVGEIGNLVERSTAVAREAVARLQDSDAAVGGLSEAARQIGTIVELINKIATQTNLLALNATIEAARAGEVGKGFAVVANEVKSLARQTADATQEIGRQVAGVQTATAQAASGLAAVGKTIRNVEEIATAIASAVQEQAAATRDIARNVQEVSDDSREVSAGVSDIARDSATACAGAIQVIWDINNLAGQIAYLGREVNSFLAKSRGLAEQALLLQRQAIEACERDGLEATLARISDPAGPYRKDRLYLYVERLDGLLLAHSLLPHLAGTNNFDTQSADGRYFVRELIELAKSKGTGWIDYRFAHPQTGQVEPRSVYVQRWGNTDIAFGVGINLN